MGGLLFLLLAAMGLAMVGCGFAAVVRRRPRHGLWLFAAGNGIITVWSAIAGYWWPAGAANLTVAVVAAWLLWRWRRPRERAPRAYGAKSLARVAALTRKARDATRPRPAGRLTPQGAR